MRTRLALTLALALVLLLPGFVVAQGTVNTKTANGANVPLGSTADAAATAGSTGTVSAKLRLITTQLDSILTAVGTTLAGYLDGVEALLTTIDADTGTLAGAVSSGKIKVQLTTSAGDEIVVPTAGSTHYDAADASTNATTIKASAGTVYHYSLSNTTATVYYLRMYNLASGPTCSSATGFVESITIPASTSGAGRERTMNIGQAFTTGIAYCITASATSTANDNAAAGVIVSILYK